MRVNMTRESNRIWFVVETEKFEDYSRIYFQSDIGYFVILEDGTVISSNSIKVLWNERRWIAQQVVENYEKFLNI